MIFRDTKGSPLTHGEVDGNFRHLTGSQIISSSGTPTNQATLRVEGAISASGAITASALFLTDGYTNLNLTSISASGIISASGLYLSGNSNLDVTEISASNLHLSGDAYIGGNITLGGNMIGGDNSSDSITLNADITSNLRPNTDDTYDIGTESLRWQDVHASSVNAEVLALNKITASGTSTLAAGQNGIWMGPFSISGTVDIGAGSNFVVTSFNRMTEINLINVSDY
tara:strand:- start:65 stop:748 length:684 start_codon:yes stop_codon:yes gene_type:complete